jgi:hypothetical protein
VSWPCIRPGLQPTSPPCQVMYMMYSRLYVCLPVCTSTRTVFWVSLTCHCRLFWAPWSSPMSNLLFPRSPFINPGPKQAEFGSVSVRSPQSLLMGVRGLVSSYGLVQSPWLPHFSWSVRVDWNKLATQHRPITHSTLSSFATATNYSIIPITTFLLHLLPLFDWF